MNPFILDRATPIRLGSLLFALAIATAARPAAARERMAVFIVVGDDVGIGDGDLSDNLAEIAIAKLAEGHDRDLVGTRELRDRLPPIVGPEGLAACLERASCLQRVGEVAMVDRAVIGDVRRQGETLRLSLALTDTRTQAREAEVSRVAAAELGPLIVAVREGVTALLAARAVKAPIAPALAAAVDRGAAPARQPEVARSVGSPAGASAAAAPGGRNTRSTGVPPFVTYGSAGLAVISFSAAAVTGVVAGEAPVGATRASRQDDLNRRVHEAGVANALLISGVVFAAIAVASYLWRGPHDRPSGP